MLTASTPMRTSAGASRLLSSGEDLLVGVFARHLWVRGLELLVHAVDERFVRVAAQLLATWAGHDLHATSLL
jgi:hypothetical protein